MPHQNRTSFRKLSPEAYRILLTHQHRQQHGGSSPDVIIIRLRTVSIGSFTRSIGAAAVFETAAETPPMRKSIAKLAIPFSAGACTKTGEAFAVISDRSWEAWQDLSPALQ
nr:Cytochrome 82A4 [Ipomoea batatas]